MTNIDFLIQNLEGGGAERVIVNILNNLDENKFKSALFLVENKGSYLKNLNKKIEIKIFNNFFKNRKLDFILNLFKIFYILNKKKKSIIFSQYHPGKILGLIAPIFFKNRKIIYRETNIPQEINNVNESSIKILDRLFYKYGIKNFNKIIVQSLDMKKMLLSIDNSLERKIILINNPVDIEFIEEEIKDKEIMRDNKKLNLITIGRLNKQKGYDLLINTLGKIENKNFVLNILGIGKEEEKLKKIVKENNLQEQVFFLGFKHNPYKYLVNSDFYISSSRFEGFPNAVLEANACGVPVIANNYKGGISEIILKNINGEIIDIIDHIQLEKALQKKYNSEEIKKSILKRYDTKVIVKKYEKLFEKMENEK